MGMHVSTFLRLVGVGNENPPQLHVRLLRSSATSCIGFEAFFLHLAGNRITDAVVNLCDVLKENNTVRELNLQSMSIHNAVRGRVAGMNGIWFGLRSAVCPAGMCRWEVCVWDLAKYRFGANCGSCPLCWSLHGPFPRSDTLLDEDICQRMSDGLLTNQSLMSINFAGVVHACPRVFVAVLACAKRKVPNVLHPRGTVGHDACCTTWRTVEGGTHRDTSGKRWH